MIEREKKIANKMSFLNKLLIAVYAAFPFRSVKMRNDFLLQTSVMSVCKDLKKIIHFFSCTFNALWLFK